MLLIAHRGGAKYAPENTLAAFRHAVRLGCTAVELDIHLTLDGHLAVIHDERVDRTTNGTGEVSMMTREELQRLDAGIRFSKEFTGEPIPMLDQVLDALPRAVRVHIEIKGNPQGPEQEQRLLELIQSKGRQQNIVVSSFHHQRLAVFHGLDPDIPLGVLGDHIPPDPMGYLESLGFKAHSLHLDHRALTPAVVQLIKENGYELYAYTVNRLHRARILSDWGVDGIFTDDPLMAI